MRRTFVALSVAAFSSIWGCQIVLNLETKELVGDAGVTTSTDGATTSPDGASTADIDAGPCTGDLSGNAGHCGRCDHSCGGGKCVASVCSAVTVLAEQKNPWEVVTDDKYVFFTNEGANGDVIRADKSGTNPVTVAASLLQPRGLTVKNGRVYWVTSVGAFSSPVDQPSISGLSSVNKPERLAVVDKTLYWTQRLVDGGVSACTLSAGGSCGPPSSITGLQLAPSVISADETAVAWTYIGPQDGFEVKTGSVHLCMLPCTAPRVIADNRTAPLGVVVHKGQLFWTEEGSHYGELSNGLVRTCKLPECTPIVDLAVNQLRPTAIAVDDEWIAWVNQGYVATGAVYLCPRSDCSNPIVVADKMSSPSGVAMDASFVYWTIHYSGLVMRRAKP